MLLQRYDLETKVALKADSRWEEAGGSNEFLMLLDMINGATKDTEEEPTEQTDSNPGFPVREDNSSLSEPGNLGSSDATKDVYGPRR